MTVKLHVRPDKVGTERRARVGLAAFYPQSGIHAQPDRRVVTGRELGLLAGNDYHDDQRQDAEEQAEEAPDYGAAPLHGGDDGADDGRNDTSYRDEDPFDPAQNET